ncbi:MAG: histidine kinase N-terminal 7TM domain-containing protein [Endomicrobiales bacterium]|jgi:hypothetical protein
MIETIFTFSQYFFNIYAIPFLLTGMGIVTLGTVIFFNKRNSLTNISFLSLCLSIGLWLTGESLMYLSKDIVLAKFWYSVAFLGVTLISSTLFTFSACFLNQAKQLKYFILLGYGLSFYFYYLSVHSTRFIIGMKKYFWGWYPLFGSLSYPFLIQWGSLMVVCLWMYIHALRNITDFDERMRVKYILFGLLIAYLGAFDYIAAYGITFYPFGYIPILCLVAIIAYAMRQYRLLLTPAMAATTILNTMVEALIVFASDGKILSVNL